jgi:hypothetical protein
MRDWIMIFILLFLIVFVLYSSCSRCGKIEGLANQELIANSTFSAPVFTGANTSININNATTGFTWERIRNPVRDISLCGNIASTNIVSPGTNYPRYVILKGDDSIRQTVNITDRGEYLLSIRACGNNPINVDLSSNGTSKSILTFTPSATWKFYPDDIGKQFTINDTTGTEQIIISGGGTPTDTKTTGIGIVSLQSVFGDTQSNTDIKQTLTDMSNNIIGRMADISNNLSKMTTNEDTQFANMLAAINNIQSSMNTNRSTNDKGVNKYSGF